MAVYIGHDECQVIYVAKNGQQLRVSSVWVGDQQVFPPANRQEVHLFTRDTQGYGRTDNGTFFGFTVPVPWWATSLDVVIIGAGEKGRDGTKSFTGGTDGAGGRSGAWVVKTIALNQYTDAVVNIGKGTSTSPAATAVAILSADGQSGVGVSDGEGTRTANSGARGGDVTPRTRTEFANSHTGGIGGTRNNPGGHPGGGGGGGQGSNLLGNPTTGQPGGDGRVWLRFRSDAPISGGGFTLYLGTTSGNAGDPVTEWAGSVGKTRQTITEITVPVSIVAPVMQGAFYGCSSLTTAPDMDTSQVVNMSTMFAQCGALTTVPAMNTSNVTDMSHMFSGCASLKSIPEMDTGRVSTMNSTFYGCTSLQSVPPLNVEGVSDMGYAFGRCQSLTSAPLKNVGANLDMRETALTPESANELMQGLKTVSGKTLRLPATATGADTTIAAAKNWTVTVG